MVKSSVGLGLFLFASVVSAYQRVPVLEGHEVNANISVDGLNRDRKSTRLNSSHSQQSRMPSSA